MIITQTFTMARWQIVVKKSEATKQIKDQNKQTITAITTTTTTTTTTTNKTGGGGRGKVAEARAETDLN